MDLKGKAAIVTGSATGVGRATALQLARRGCAVLINFSRNQTAAQRVVEEVEALGVAALGFRADVANDDDCRAMVAAAEQTFGRLDVLVNNAGTTRFIPHDDLDAVTLQDWDTILGVNTRGPFQVARAARKALEASGRGNIVNVSSTASLRGIGSSIPYCASKAALNNLTLTLARVLAPKIRVNAVAPGFIATDMTAATASRMKVDFEDFQRMAAEQIPVRRVGVPDDVAHTISYLASEGAGFVSGQVIYVAGGPLN